MGGCCIGNCCVMNNFIGDFVRDIFGGSSGGCGYHPGPSETEEHAKKIADELAQMKENIRNSSEEKEKEIIEYINRSMGDLLGLLENVNQESFGGRKLNINIQGINKKNEDLQKEVIGYIGNYMDDRLTLTDKELSVILEERNDKKRAENFDNFVVKLQKKSLDGLKKKIQDTVKKQEEMITSEINNRLQEVDKSMKETEKAYMDILSIKENDETKMSQNQIKYMYKYNVADILSDQFNQ